MDLLKALKRTTILTTAVSVAAMFALGATDARADSVSFLAKANASVVGTLGITEVQQLNFGNMSVTAGSGAATDSVTLAPTGVRTNNQGTHLTLLDGATTGGVTGASNLETGGEVPGVYTIASDGTDNVYVSFADNTGHLMDPLHGTVGTTSSIGTFSVALTKDNGGAPNVAATPQFAVDSFTFALGSGTGAAYTTGAAETPDGTTLWRQLRCLFRWLHTPYRRDTAYEYCGGSRLSAWPLYRHVRAYGFLLSIASFSCSNRKPLRVKSAGVFVCCRHHHTSPPPPCAGA